MSWVLTCANWRWAARSSRSRRWTLAVSLSRLVRRARRCWARAWAALEEEEEEEEEEDDDDDDNKEEEGEEDEEDEDEDEDEDDKEEEEEDKELK